MKKKISILLACCMLVSAATGCGISGGNEVEKTNEEIAAVVEASDEQINERTSEQIDEQINEQTTQNENGIDPDGTHVVVDFTGESIEVPNTIERVVIDQIPILSTYMAYFEGSAPYIVGYCGSFKTVISETALKNIAPELMESSDTVYAQSDLNIEEIVKLQPDIILYNAGNTQHAEILKKSGIPCIGFPTVGASTPADPIERYEEWLNLLEDVFGEPGKTDAFVTAGDAIVAEVEDIISSIPEDNRPTAMQLFSYADGVPKVAGNGVFGDFWLKHLGVKNVAAETTTGFAQVSVEQIYEWDPDIIFDNGPGLCSIRPADIIANNVEGIDFSILSAVKNKRVYDTTLGMWNWTTPNPDAPLVLAWMACNTYPDEFADYPLADKIKEYYKTWYKYDVTSEELEGMLNN